MTGGDTGIAVGYYSIHCCCFGALCVFADTYKFKAELALYQVAAGDGLMCLHCCAGRCYFIVVMEGRNFTCSKFCIVLYVYYSVFQIAFSVICYFYGYRYYFFIILHTVCITFRLLLSDGVSVSTYCIVSNLSKLHICSSHFIFHLCCRNFHGLKYLTLCIYKIKDEFVFYHISAMELLRYFKLCLGRCGLVFIGEGDSFLCCSTNLVGLRSNSQMTIGIILYYYFYSIYAGIVSYTALVFFYFAYFVLIGTGFCKGNTWEGKALICSVTNCEAIYYLTILSQSSFRII